MTFQAQIDDHLRAAMKARQTDRLGVLRMLKSALQNASIEKGGTDFELDEASATAVVRRELKKRQDAIQGFEKGQRLELAAKEAAEAEILAQYLPQALSGEELKSLIAACIAETHATGKAQMGAVMKLAGERAAGRAEGRALSSEVGAQLDAL